MMRTATGAVRDMPEPTADTRQTHWSDPGPHAARLCAIPASARAIPDVLEQFVIHHAIARGLGYRVPQAAEGDRDLRTVARLLDAAMQRDPRPLTVHRALAGYLYGTCHDFALLAASVLRANGVPARVRVGFACYFRPGQWEDHWVCEYWTGTRWAVLDAQLGARARAARGIGFDVADVPASGWRSAASIWRGIRSGDIDPAICGVSFIGITGAWFVAASTLRDAACLAGVEALPWDYWGPGLDFVATRQVSDSAARQIDALSEAFDPPPPSRDAAETVLDRHPWAKPPPVVLSFPEGRGRCEVALADA